MTVDERSGRRSTLFLMAGLCAAALFAAAPRWPLVQALLYLGMGVAESVVVVASVRRMPPASRAAWNVIAAAVVLNTVANAIWFGYPVVLRGHLPFPSVADAAFFAAYSCVAVGLILMIRSRSAGADRLGTLVDSAIITVAAAFFAWVHVLAPTAALSTGSTLQRGVALGYPLFDLALVALVARMVFTRGSRSAGFWMVCGWVTAQLVGDVAYSLTVLRGTFAYSQAMNAAWIVSFALVGAAALHPSSRAISDPAPRHREPRAPLARLGAVTVAVLLVPTEGLLAEHVSKELLLGSALLLFALSAVRTAILVRELQVNAAALERREGELHSTIVRLNQSEDNLAYQAHHDELTGLPNRAFFLRRLERVLSRPDVPVAVMLLDLDGFKTINDSLGHAAGDALLAEVSRRLSEGLRGADVVARLGGDEFTVIAEGVDEAGAVGLASRLLASLDAPLDLQTKTVFCQASVGIAVGTGWSHKPADLLRNADAAMYTAKRRGGRRFELFTIDMHERALERLALETSLREVALGTDMTLHYQPLIDLATGDLVGFEALLRWQHPDRGVISPGEFIPIAEETGDIIRIGRWVLHEACRQVRDWQLAYAGAARLGINVNVSARQLADETIVDDVASILEATGLDPGLLTIEITETMIMADEDEVRACLIQLKALGVRISVDDFGTGYSSLGHLDRFPVDELKIDRSFVAKLGSGTDGAGVAAAAIRLARGLHIDVVAEGIENEEQLAELRSTSCTLGQGYLFSRPLDAAAADAYVRRGDNVAMPPAQRVVVLVVDDEPAVRQSTCRILEGAGLATVQAGSGAEALAIAGETACDAVVLDVGLPDMDGYTVSQRLVELHHAAIPIIYLSGTATAADDRALGFEAGGDCYLIKPTPARELIAAVRAVIRARAGTGHLSPARPLATAATGRRPHPVG